MAQRVVLDGIRPSDYEHPVDIEALSVLRNMPTLRRVVTKVNEIGFDEIIRLHSLGNKIRVSSDQFPKLQDLFDEIMKTLDMESDVDLFVEQSFSLNAYASGVVYQQVTVTTELVNALTTEEMRFVLGHELGHIKSQHVLYHQIGRYFPYLLSILGEMTLGVGRLVGTGFQVALYDWMRKSELSADRAGLLACQSPIASHSAFCKLAGVPPKWLEQLNMDEIERQADDYQALTGATRNKLYGYFGQMFSSHPWIIIRFRELNKWINDGYFNRVLDSFAVHMARQGENYRVCPECGKKTRADFTSCVYCGHYFDSTL